MFSKPKPASDQDYYDQFDKILEKVRNQGNKTSFPPAEAEVEDDICEKIDSNIDYRNYVHVQDTTDIENGFSIGSLNVRSMLKNEERVKELLQISKFDVLAVQETWNSNSKFDDYEFVQTTRKGLFGGRNTFLD